MEMDKTMKADSQCNSTKPVQKLYKLGNPSGIRPVKQKGILSHYS